MKGFPPKLPEGDVRLWSSAGQLAGVNQPLSEAEGGGGAQRAPPGSAGARRVHFAEPAARYAPPAEAEPPARGPPLRWIFLADTHYEYLGGEDRVPAVWGDPTVVADAGEDIGVVLLGDVGRMDNAGRYIDSLCGLPRVKHVVLVPGNHDSGFHGCAEHVAANPRLMGDVFPLGSAESRRATVSLLEYAEPACRPASPKFHLLVECGVEAGGVTLYGHALRPRMQGTGTHRAMQVLGGAYADALACIPAECVVMSHVPPMFASGELDLGVDSRGRDAPYTHRGCELLAREMGEKNTVGAIFGHIHGGGGCVEAPPRGGGDLAVLASGHRLALAMNVSQVTCERFPAWMRAGGEVPWCADKMREARACFAAVVSLQMHEAGRATYRLTSAPATLSGPGEYGLPSVVKPDTDVSLGALAPALAAGDGQGERDEGQPAKRPKLCTGAEALAGAGTATGGYDASTASAAPEPTLPGWKVEWSSKWGRWYANLADAR